MSALTPPNDACAPAAAEVLPPDGQPDLPSGRHSDRPRSRRQDLVPDPVLDQLESGTTAAGWARSPSDRIIDPGLPHTDRMAPQRTPLLTLVRAPGAWFIRHYWDVHFHGRGHVPTHGPAILAANHLSALDGPILVAMAPRPSFALAKIELFHGVLGRALRGIGQIPVNRRALDVSAITRAVQLLRSGQLLAVFPEGFRGTGAVSHARNGVAYLAMVTGAPVVPVAMLGTRESGQSRHGVPRRRAEMHVVFGEPLPVSQTPWPRRKSAVAAQTERIRQHLADHVRQAQLLTGVALPGEPKPTLHPLAALEHLRDQLVDPPEPKQPGRAADRTTEPAAGPLELEEERD